MCKNQTLVMQRAKPDDKDMQRLNILPILWQRLYQKLQNMLQISHISILKLLRYVTNYNHMQNLTIWFVKIHKITR